MIDNLLDEKEKKVMIAAELCAINLLQSTSEAMFNFFVDNKEDINKFNHLFLMHAMATFITANCSIMEATGKSMGKSETYTADLLISNVFEGCKHLLSKNIYSRNILSAIEKINDLNNMH